MGNDNNIGQGAREQTSYAFLPAGRSSKALYDVTSWGALSGNPEGHRFASALARRYASSIASGETQYEPNHKEYPGAMRIERGAFEILVLPFGKKSLEVLERQKASALS